MACLVGPKGESMNMYELKSNLVKRGSLGSYIGGVLQRLQREVARNLDDSSYEDNRG